MLKKKSHTHTHIGQSTQGETNKISDLFLSMHSICVPGALGGQMVVSHNVVLGIKLQSSRKAAGSLNC